MKLKVEEAVAIRWHMGGFDDADVYKRQRSCRTSEVDLFQTQQRQNVDLDSLQQLVDGGSLVGTCLLYTSRATLYETAATDPFGLWPLCRRDHP